MIFKKIGKKYALVLFAVAFVFDALSLIFGMNYVVAVFGQFVMACLFYLGGVNVFRNRAAFMYVLSTVLEAIPAASALPFFIVETAAIIAFSRSGRA